MSKQLPADIKRLAVATRTTLRERRHQQIAGSYRRLDEGRARHQHAQRRRWVRLASR
jgi:hypothetical protein